MKLCDEVVNCCVFFLGIERNEIGNTMKAHMNTMGLIDKCIKSLSTNAPTVETVLMLKADDVFWKEFVSKPGESQNEK